MLILKKFRKYDIFYKFKKYFISKNIFKMEQILMKDNKKLRRKYNFYKKLK